MRYHLPYPLHRRNTPPHRFRRGKFIAITQNPKIDYKTISSNTILFRVRDDYYYLQKDWEDSLQYYHFHLPVHDSPPLENSSNLCLCTEATNRKKVVLHNPNATLAF